MQSITLPQLGDGVVAATVVRWLKQPGDGFSAGDALVELEIEDALVHLEASQSGTLARVLAQPRETVEVGAELARVEATGGPAPQPEPERTVTQQLSDSPETPGNVTPILMPQAGNTMEEGIVVSWSVAAGDHIEVGQIICEIETDKATIEYESPEAGCLARIVVREGEAIPVKEPIAFLADNDTDVDAYLAARGATAAVVAAPSAGAAAGSSAKAVTVAAEARVGSGLSPVTAEGRIKASPAARKTARERGIDLASLGPGSGPGGRILSTDVEKAKVTAIVSADGRPIGRPMPKMRRAIGLNLQRSKQTVPHFYVRLTVTNLGMFGVEEFSAIINPPESGILAVSAVRETVIVENGTMRPGRVMTMTLSADHRVVDGLLAAKFLGRLKEILENPSEGLG